VDSILQSCPAYLEQDVDSELRPSISRLRHLLGSKLLAKALNNHNKLDNPRLLLRPLSEFEALCNWLASLGVHDPQPMLLRRPQLFKAKVDSLKATVACLRTSMPLVDVGQLISRRPPQVLSSSADSVQEKLSFIAEVLEASQTSEAFSDFISTSCHQRLFSTPLAQQQRGLAYLRTLGVQKAGCIQALRKGVVNVPAATMTQRAEHITQRLNLSRYSLGVIVNSHPHVLSCTPSRIDINLATLTNLGFHPADVNDMAKRFPSLLFADWNTSVRQEKWHYLSHVMGLNTSDIVQTPVMLRASVKGILLPRWEFLKCVAIVQKVSHKDCIARMCSSIYQSDKGFALRNNVLQKHLLYTECFKEACLK